MFSYDEERTVNAEGGIKGRERGKREHEYKRGFGRKWQHGREGAQGNLRKLQDEDEEVRGEDDWRRRGEHKRKKQIQCGMS